MPQSITIAAFVLGSVLLLIALVGGKFKIFGAEISGTAGRAGRYFAAVAGILLIIIGLFGALPTPRWFPKPPSPTPIIPPNPQIFSFQATPFEIKEGGTAQLQWAVKDASIVGIDQEIGNVPLSGSRTVSPKTTTVYILSASQGSVIRQATTKVIVIPMAWEDKNSIGALPGDGIHNFRVLSYANDNLVAELSYQFNPQHGQVWIGGYLLDKNEQSISGGFFPAEASPAGKTNIKVGVDPSKGRVQSKWVFFWIYESNKSEGFVSKRFPYEHFWN